MTAMLRPMSLGEILDRTFQMYRSSFLAFVGIAVLPLSVQMALYLIGFPIEGLVRQTTISVILQREIIDGYGWIATRFSSYFLYYAMWPVFCVVAGQILFQERCNIRAALLECRSRWRGLLALTVLFWLLENRVPSWLHGKMWRAWLTMPFWLSFLVSTVEGFALLAPLLLSVPAWTFERASIAESIARSWTLSKGAYGRMFIAVLLHAVCYRSITFMLSLIVYLVWILGNRDVLSGPMSSSWMFLPGYIASIFAAPLIPIAIALIYYDQRIRLEGFDIEWMMDAAGMTAKIPDRNSAEEVAAVLGEGDSRMRLARFGVFAVICLAICVQAQEPAPTRAAKAVRAHDVSMDEYRQHLAGLESLVDACAKARNPKECDPAAVGQDDRVPVTIGSKPELRLVRYDWLRAVLGEAQSPDKGSEKPEAPAQNAKQALGIEQESKPIPELLKDSKTRLEGDLTRSGESLQAADHSNERAAMREVLARAEFRNLQEQTVKQSLLEKFAGWLNHIFASASFLHTRAAWIGRVLVWGFILGVSLVLLVALLRLERRWRVRLTPDVGEGPAPGAPSSRDWQLWLEDARRAAAAGEWREAIHFVYWAAISRLESRRLWPADRARTPREYLALVAQEDPRKAGLSQLTKTFERFWYGGRAAGESDYRAAEGIATTLIGGGTNSIDVTGPASAEGGGQ